MPLPPPWPCWWWPAPALWGWPGPTAIAAGIARAARDGIIIRSSRVWEAVLQLDTVLVDKTGTLTYGEPVVTELVTSRHTGTALHLTDQQLATPLKRLGHHLASHSLHPLAKAVVQNCHDSEHSATDLPAEVSSWQISETAGQGIYATQDGQIMAALGSADLFSSVPPNLKSAASRAASMGYSTSYIGWQIQPETNGLVSQAPAVRTVALPSKPPATALFILSDELRLEAANTVKQLQKDGLSVTMLTGDTHKGAKIIAQKIQPDKVISRARPEDKLKIVRLLQADGCNVAVVGDGINDAAALAQANLSIAFSSGSDISRAASDITLMSPNFNSVFKAFRIAGRTRATIFENLVWACMYNAAALPLAAVGVLPPVAAAAAMSVSSLCVVGNSLRLSRYKLR